MRVVPLFSGVACALFLVAARTYPRDRARVEAGDRLATLRLSA